MPCCMTSVVGKLPVSKPLIASRRILSILLWCRYGWWHPSAWHQAVYSTVWQPIALQDLRFTTSGWEGSRGWVTGNITLWCTFITSKLQGTAFTVWKSDWRKRGSRRRRRCSTVASTTGGNPEWENTGSYPILDHPPTCQQAEGHI